MRYLLVFTITVINMFAFNVYAEAISSRETPEFSTAGFFQIENGPRDIFSFNVGWRFYKGELEDASAPNYDDSMWEIVNCPHGLEYLPVDASGSINYQGPAWYRKHFTLPEDIEGKKHFLHFEAIMGKSKIWINGKLVKEHFGGYLPVVIDITDAVRFGGEENVVAVWADNSDDPDYPPGKPQGVLDFTYFGGIYRDVWLYSKYPVHITDPTLANTTAGGGVFVHYENLSEDSVDVIIATEIKNETMQKQTIQLSSSIQNDQQEDVGAKSNEISLAPGSCRTVRQKVSIEKPHLWSPDDPYLHKLITKVSKDSTLLDGQAIRIGIRKIEFRGKEGFLLNNKPYGKPLIGANRHQDFAHIGNALPNSLHWRDALKLRNANMEIVRSAHYPQDPAFMEACDQLGMFVIVATPGWQFWNEKEIFAKRVCQDIRNMVRRDRNHPCVIMWEPILNETHYPNTFAKRVHETVHEEFPFDGCYTACDGRANGSEYFDVIYGGKTDHRKSAFIREWGDNVDDWSAHNSTSRVRRSWGEAAQIIQARHYADPRPDYSWICIDSFYGNPAQITGGCLWHSFDHNRGYHPDQFFGGIADAFRQPKYSYYVIQSQRNPKSQIPYVENGPMVYIANEMTPFSSGDVWVYSNCEEIRLKVFGEVFDTIRPADLDADMPHPPVKFENVYNFMDLKQLHRAKKWDQAKIVAEGLIDGKVVASTTRMPAKRKHHLDLIIDSGGMPLTADGSDVITVIARMVDKDGNIKRLCDDRIVFEVTGPARLIDAKNIGTNPARLEWGTAPCLIQSTTEPGKITVRAKMLHEGINTPLPGEISFKSVPYAIRQIYEETACQAINADDLSVEEASDSETVRKLKKKLRTVQGELNELRLKEIGRQQTEFEN
ncbi:Beta-galactosidase [Anaerohalosphaera lusitana]|uniref:Beta-galactosidase n=1 Tax=Anaerohalosphaera lusitana TaxID=1936003 RepID=A0A1U9NMI8_9BACT|nr:glycoside hydrolase family 2 TIM barrel-domain containing protein [Anaerohalosphaera lusitana]AQT68810.1 Beta-galactosidase [Anaerohalosphaera lusitana]